MNSIIKLYKKYRQILLYIFFGVCTTLINTVLYELLYKFANVSNVVSTALAWFAAVLFAFITNKQYVFNYSSKGSKNEFVQQLFSFFVCRGATGILDIIIMVVAVDCLNLNSLLWKLISNILVTIVNYIASKFFIFKNDKN